VSVRRDRDELSEVDSDPARSGYMTRKDLKVILIAFPILVAILMPIYCGMKRDADLHICTSNFGAISKAIGQYSASWDERFPPAYAMEGDALPLLDSRDRPSTWATLVSQYLNVRASFLCPSATQEEVVTAQHWSESERSVAMAYGLYAPLGGFPVATVYQPSQTALISETSDRGSLETYDPAKFVSAAGKVLPDGFLIAWDNSNSEFSKTTKSVTRLAFYKTSDGKFSENGQTRHDGGINFLFCDGHVEMLKPEAALVRHLGQDLTGLWSNGYK